jgi:biotin transport system substrate-specific component
MTKIKSLVLVSFFAALTSVSALIAIPIGPVPVTLQTAFVLLSGYALGPKNGTISQLIYIAIGLIGLPVFSKGGSGLGHLIGPTGGYLIGFVAAAFFTGYFTQKKPVSFLKMFCIFFLGVAIVYTIGILQLMLVTKLPFTKAFIVGGVLFMPFDIVKILILTLALKTSDEN